jgi:hypothetical protein
VNLARRVRHLERLDALALPQSAMNRFQRALSEASRFSANEGGSARIKELQTPCGQNTHVRGRRL